MFQRHGTETEPVGYAIWSVLKTHLTINRYPDSRYLESYWEITRSPTRCSPGCPKNFPKGFSPGHNLSKHHVCRPSIWQCLQEFLGCQRLPRCLFWTKTWKWFLCGDFPLDHLGTRGKFHSNKRKKHIQVSKQWTYTYTIDRLEITPTESNWYRNYRNI